MLFLSVLFLCLCLHLWILLYQLDGIKFVQLQASDSGGGVMKTEDIGVCVLFLYTVVVIEPSG